MARTNRTSGVTGYAHIGTDFVRLTIVYLDGGCRYERADGWNAPVFEHPTEWRTSGDVVSTAATMQVAYTMSAVPDSLPEHGWKGTFSTVDFIRKMDPKNADTIINGLASYYGVDGLEVAA